MLQKIKFTNTLQMLYKIKFKMQSMHYTENKGLK